MERWREIRDQLFNLLSRLEDRLPTHQIEFVREFIDVGEWGIALEQMASVLSEDELGLRDDERADFIALNKRLGMGTGVPDALSFCPRIS